MQEKRKPGNWIGNWLKLHCSWIARYSNEGKVRLGQLWARKYSNRNLSSLEEGSEYFKLNDLRPDFNSLVYQ